MSPGEAMGRSSFDSCCIRCDCDTLLAMLDKESLQTIREVLKEELSTAFDSRLGTFKERAERDHG